MAVRTLKRSGILSDQFPSAILDSLSEAVVVVDGTGLVHYANLSAEQFFGVGRARLVGHPLNEFIPEDTPFFRCLRSEMRELLTRVISELPGKEQQVLSLYYCEELTMKEVGAVLGIGESRVSQIHSLAVVRLRSRMEELMKNKPTQSRAAGASGH